MDSAGIVVISGLTFTGLLLIIWHIYDKRNEKKEYLLERRNRNLFSHVEI
jgi:hypothetical protein